MSDNGFSKKIVFDSELKSALSRIKTRVESGIADAISDSASTLNSSITNGDSSTLNSAKSYVDGIKTTLDTTIASNLATAKGYTDGAKTALETNIGNHTGNTNNPHSVTYIQIGAAPSSHTHTESDITDLGSYASSTDLGSYGVSSISYDSNNSILTLTMKDNSTKTTTITNAGGSGSGSSSGSVTLSDLGGASATDLNNHINDTNNPHSVTYTQVGAAAASHTHVEADITDLGNYASSSHTHTESDITDLGSYATNNDLNTYGVSSVSYDDSTSILTITMKGGSTKTVTITGTSGSGSSGGSSSSSSISSVSYDDTTNNLVFTMSNNSEITCNLDDLLNQCLQYDEPTASGRTFNSEWVDRLTGTGTELDPYLIYTPKDFTKIQDHMDAHYKLMNNLDFTDLTGLSIEISGNSFTITTEDSTAPLYNDGEGYFPLGYNGYMPQSADTVNTTIKVDSYGTFTMVQGDTSSYPSNAFHIFTGELDGNSKVIKGIICSPAHTYSVGLFSFIGNGASVHDLTIQDSTFICNEVYIGWGRSSVASVAGSVTFLTYQSDPIHISNIYNYSTLISNRDTTDSGSQAKISGICGAINSTDVPGVIINECSNRGQIIIVDSTKNHRVAGIYYNDFDSNNSITNCINTANLVGYKAYGIGFKIGKVNINCGEMATQDNNTVDLYPITDQTTASYVNGIQYANETIQSVTTSSFTTDNTNNVKYKSILELKSQQFISDANIANGTDVFAYNDLNFDNGWPLLIDEYNQLSSSGGNASVDDSLDFALIDPSSNKVYSAGISLSELNTSISGLASASHTHTKSDITDFGTYASSSHTHVEADITDLGSYASSSHTHTESDITDLGNYSVTGHTHVKSDITDISDLATAAGLNTYGVDTMSFNSSTNVLTLTMKGGDTKTVTIPTGSGNGSSGASVSTIVYNETTQKLVFTFSDNSEVECSLSDLISSFLTIAPDEDTRTYNSEWVERMTGTGTELDPYLIYTPRDFMKINEDMDAHYKLMNNLDFTPLVGIDIVPNESLNTVTLRNTFDLDPSECPLYNGGEGYRPIGYDGYYPINGADKSTSSFDSNNPADIIYGNSTTSQYYVFTGELDGNSKFIKGIRSSPYNAYSVGLFSYLGNGASVHHLAIIDSVFMMNNVYAMQWRKSSVASLSGDITYINDNNNNRVNIHNIYSYATLISNRQTDGNGEQDVKINGIYARIHENYAPGCVCYQCAFRGKMMILNPNVRHQIAGIGHYMNYGDMDSRITNCINTCNLSGFYVQGIGQNLGKVNINCGVVSKLSPATGKSGIFSLSGHRNTGYVNGKQFSINTNLSYDEQSNEGSNNSNNYYFKSASNLKSRFFIIEANSLSDNDVFAYNDLGIDNGWPLLVDEYAMFNSVDQSLTVGLIDSTNNQIVDSSFSIQKLNSLADFNTLVSYVDTSTSGLSPANHTHTESDITDLGSYATNSDLNTYGVSSMSYDDNTSVLTLTMKDNNTKTVTITGSGSSSGSGGSSSLTLSDITDVTATSTEINYLSGATSNIQTQISNLLNLVFPKVERSTYYSAGVRVASPLTPFIYFESLTSGYTSSSDTIKWITKVSFDPSNSFALVDNGTDVGLTSSTVYFTPGKIFKDGSVLWFIGNLTDGHIPGEIIFKALAGTSTDGYLDLSKTSKYCLSITTYQGIVDADITGIRVVKEYIDNRHWLNITANQILIMTSQSYMSMSNNAVANSKNLFKVSFTLSNQASSNELLTYINDNSLSNDNVKFLFYFAVIQIMKKYVSNPKSFISTFTSITSTDISKYNTATGLSYTSSDYLGFTNALINTIITALGESGSTVSIRLEALPLYGYFVKMNKPDYIGNLENAGLPNITGNITSHLYTNQFPSEAEATEDSTNYNGALKFYTSDYNSITAFSSLTKNACVGISFDASKSNSIYGNSTTVTPQNVSLVPLMKV